MALAVVFGAFGAHGLKARLEPEELAQWNTGVQYHFLHALGMLLLASLSAHLPPRAMARVRVLFMLGILFFSGSLYILSTRGIMDTHALTPVLGPVTPVGGLFFVAGWVLLLITTLVKKEQR